MEYNRTPINPCLHCGGKGIVKGRKKMLVVCSECGAQGPEQPLRSQAIASWNHDTLVRCEECKFYDSAFHLCQIHQSIYTSYDTDDFCSKGVRKGKHNG